MFQACTVQTPHWNLKSMSGQGRTAGLVDNDNDDCKDFCDSTVQWFRFWRLCGSYCTNGKHRLWTRFSILLRRSASFLLFFRHVFFSLSRSTSHHPPQRFCYVWVFLSFLPRWARPEALIAKLVYIGEINALQMRLNTYSKNADSAYRDYRPSQEAEKRAAARRVCLIHFQEEDLAYPCLSVIPGII